MVAGAVAGRARASWARCAWRRPSSRLVGVSRAHGTGRATCVGLLACRARAPAGWLASLGSGTLLACLEALATGDAAGACWRTCRVAVARRRRWAGRAALAAGLGVGVRHAAGAAAVRAACALLLLQPPCRRHNWQLLVGLLLLQRLLRHMPQAARGACGQDEALLLAGLAMLHWRVALHVAALLARRHRVLTPAGPTAAAAAVTS